MSTRGFSPIIFLSCLTVFAVSVRHADGGILRVVPITSLPLEVGQAGGNLVPHYASRLCERTVARDGLDCDLAQIFICCGRCGLHCDCDWLNFVLVRELNLEAGPGGQIILELLNLAFEFAPEHTTIDRATVEGSITQCEQLIV